MAGYPQGSQVAGEVEVYSTDAYSGSDTDVDATERYGVDINLTANVQFGMDIKLVEIGGASGTDNVLMTVYSRRDNTWDGDEQKIDEKEYTNDGSEDIFRYVIDALKTGFGHYRVSFQATPGGTNTFDLDAQGYYSRFHNSDT